MDGVLGNFKYLVVIVFSTAIVDAVPPEACFANFRWDDCGGPPTPVMYYYKSGSRCEVGIWRGCLPNLNMFLDEYECINTCIFVERAHPDDFHEHLKDENMLTTGLDFDDGNSTNTTGTIDGNGTDTNSTGGTTVAEEGDGDAPGEEE